MFRRLHRFQQMVRAVLSIAFEAWEELINGWGVGLRVSCVAVDVSMSRSQTSVSTLDRITL